MKLLLLCAVATSVAVSVFSHKKEPGIKPQAQPQRISISSVPRLIFSCVDSTRYSKDRSMVYLYGNARLSFDKTTVLAEVIAYNGKTNTLKAWKNARVIRDNDQQEIKGQDSLTYKF